MLQWPGAHALWPCELALWGHSENVCLLLLDGKANTAALRELGENATDWKYFLSCCLEHTAKVRGYIFPIILANLLMTIYNGGMEAATLAACFALEEPPA